MRRLPSLLLHAGLLIIGVITVFPFVWMLLSAFKPNSEIRALDQSLLPREWTLENFLTIQENFDFLRLFSNSVILAVTITAISIYTSVLAGYVLGKYVFRGRGLLFGFILATMMIPWAVTIIPRYTMFADVGLKGTWASLIIPAVFSGFGIFMMKQSMDSIPDEILEAARMDGASELYIFHRIVLPMSTNSISALAIFQFLWVWEDYLWPYLMIDDDSLQVLAVGLTTFSGRYSTDYGGLFAATTLSIVPVLAVYLIFQKRFIAGAASAAVKG
ncbi:carbohydrate ABC transporter permease [Brachybacterium sp. J153]|uniref:carbohydrate ABC transporter permease n=1 Tax=Brachybacterium sp. J153 TaxID=3116488 RepID=UPI002E77F438|nr:carbohydrate ABC transporter permease [Brachybacterium sp. J153]MEE1619642.1 carbohydrate ABC transporter permease [Brachybacterium sp. J153]